LERQPDQTLKDPEIIRRAAEWYGRCVARIERDIQQKAARERIGVAEAQKGA